ncbi:BMA-LIN-40, isoform a [Aphelenchoides fujianensis]|nr:BMA-LIN-40, isoform a [Aphelenchoides fujianensis]
MADATVKKEGTSQNVQVSAMAQNMYRVGDYVYFENFPSSPYNIRRIEELNKTASGTVEAKVVCFFRRRDLPAALLKIADKAERQSEILSRPRRCLLTRKSVGNSNGVANGEEEEENGIAETPDEGGSSKSKDAGTAESGGLAGLPSGADKLEPIEVHRLRQQELFLSRQIDTLPATQIRGKCTVVMLSEVDAVESYKNREDSFFYSLIAEADEEPEKDVKPPVRTRRHSRQIDDIYETRYESLVYHPYHSLTDRDIDQFLIIARAVGTFSRALDTSSTMKLPSLHMTAAAASRDVALFHAMALLHQANYDIGKAVKYLVPPPSKQHYPLDADKGTGHNTVSLGGPILCRDQLEEWSAAEATLFEEAIEKCGKDFHDIRAEALSWKSIRDIVEYYYMWKTTARHAEMQRTKLAEQENKLKQVYIPNYNKPNPNQVGRQNASNELVKSASPCESCQTDESTAWFAWGPAHLQLRLCNDCWVHWKKHGGLKKVHEYEAYDLDGATDLSAGRGLAGRGNGHFYQGKDRGAFYLNTTFHVRLARGIAPRNIFNIRKAARSPTKPIDATAIINHCTSSVHFPFFHSMDVRLDYSRPIADILRTANAIKLRQKSVLPQALADLLTRLHNQHRRE